MSAAPRSAARESEALLAGPEIRVGVGATEHHDPLRLLREVIDSLNASNGKLPDEAQVSGLLAEAREALERANVVARALTQCNGFLQEAQFEKAFQTLDISLQAYPDEPALIARRAEVEKQRRAYFAAADVRKAMEEAQWLLDQDRPDLAAALLKGKATDLPGYPELNCRLRDLEAMLPEWENSRGVRTALEQAAALEQLQQWQAALTILEEASQSYSTSEALMIAARRVRERLGNHDREKKLALRVKLIAQKIATQSWQPALTLLEEAQKEFPHAPELEPLHRAVDAGLRRSECEAVTAAVRQCIEDGEIELAKQTLRSGMESLGPEPELQRLSEEVATEARYRAGLRTAQTFFGRRQLQDAEAVLSELVGPNRPEAQALLDAVRQARLVTEEGDFCERGREKVLMLMQQRQYAQAFDLITNLRTLFPGNPILERDLIAVRNALAQPSAGAPPSETPDGALEVSKPSAPVPLERPAAPAKGRVEAREPVRTGNASRVRRAAIAGAASLMLASAGGAAWKLSRSSAPAPKPTTTPAITQPAAAATPAPVDREEVANVPETLPEPAPQSPQPSPIAVTASESQVRSAKQSAPQPPTPLRPFVKPAPQPATVQAAGSGLPLPPGAGPSVSVEAVVGLPSGLVKPAGMPERPQPAAPAPAPPPKPALPTGGNVQEAQLVQRVMPEYPRMALQLGVSGVVQLDASIDENGNVSNVKLVKGDPTLAAAAEAAVRKWKYKPATLNGKPVPVSVSVEMAFKKGSN